MAKPGLDGHDRGIKIEKAYRDAGMEVIYLGLRQTPDMIVNAAIQEDADVIALSVLSGAHMTIFTKVMDLLKENINDILFWWWNHSKMIWNILNLLVLVDFLLQVLR